MQITPNQVTTLRVAMAFAAVGFFGLAPNGLAGRHVWPSLAALGLIVAAIALDAVDGYLARRYGLATPLGAQFDILGDRVIENLFFTYFAVCGLISLWVPIVFFVRGTLTDFLRSLAARAGRVGFGKNSMLESWWGWALVSSRVSRAAYAALKCVCFCSLGLELTLARSATAGLNIIWADGGALLRLGSQVLIAATVSFCLVRALPVLWEGRRYLAAAGERSRRAFARAGSRVSQHRDARMGAPAR